MLFQVAMLLTAEFWTRFENCESLILEVFDPGSVTGTDHPTERVTLRQYFPKCWFQKGFEKKNYCGSYWYNDFTGYCYEGLPNGQRIVEEGEFFGIVEIASGFNLNPAETWSTLGLNPERVNIPHDCDQKVSLTPSYVETCGYRREEVAARLALQLKAGMTARLVFKPDFGPVETFQICS